MAVPPQKHPCALPKLVQFIGERVVLHMESGANVIGTLTDITPGRYLVMTNVYNERVDGITTFHGVMVIPHMEIMIVCRYSKCQIVGQPPIPEGAEPQHTPIQAEGVAAALETDSSKPVKTQGKSPETLIHMGESSKSNYPTPAKNPLQKLSKFSKCQHAHLVAAGSGALGIVDGDFLQAEGGECLETGGGYVEVKDQEESETDSDKLCIVEPDETQDEDDL